MISSISPQQATYQTSESILHRLPILKHLFPINYFSNSDASTDKLKHRTIRHLTHISTRSVDELNAQWDMYLKDVEKELLNGSVNKLDPKSKECLTTILKNLSLPNLEKFFEHLVDIAANHGAAISDLAIDSLPLESMLKALQEHYPDKFTTIDDYVGQLARCLPPEKPQPPAGRLTTSSSDTGNIVTRFFPNLGRIFSRAFDLFDAPRPPDTVYEYGVIATLYISFFKIPYHLIEGLSYLVPNPWHILITSVVVIGLAVATLYTWLRWLKPCPSQVDYCNNWTEKYSAIKTEQLLCRENKLDEAVKHLGAGRCVVFVGEPGVGKTKMMQSLVSKVDKRAFAFDNCKLFGMGNGILSAAEKMSIAFGQVKGFENQVFFICDELGVAYESKPSDIDSIFKVMKDEYPHIALITAITQDQWSKLIQKDKALEERFKPIFIDPTSTDETLHILENHSNPHVSVYYRGLENLIAENRKNTSHSEPRKSINSYQELLVQIEKLNPQDITTDKLRQAKTILANLKGRMALMDDPSRNPFSREFNEYLQNIAQAENALNEAELEVDIQRKLAKKIVNYQKLDRYLLQQKNKALRSLSIMNPLPEQEKIACQIRLLFTNFFALHCTEKTINSLASTLSSLNKEIRLNL
ncbi:MAG: hypothetical protein WCF65_04245 [Parachlamydiaceae bacterium]